MALVMKTLTSLRISCFKMPSRCGLSMININHIYFIESNRVHGIHAIAMAYNPSRGSIAYRICITYLFLDMCIHTFYVGRNFLRTCAPVLSYV
jgi:hypothetical protein